MARTPLGIAGRLQMSRALRECRERAGLTQTQLGDLARVSRTTIVRYENWRDTAGIEPRTVERIAAACQTEDELAASLVRLAESVGEQSWWEAYTALPSWLDPLLALEEWADRERIYATGLVPGLLQVPDYNRATHQAQIHESTSEEIEQHVQARARRQEILTQDQPLNMWAVLDEAVLRRVVGNREVMAAQLTHLLELIDRPNIEIQVMQFAAGATAAGAGYYLILDQQDGPGVVFVELQRQGLYLDSDDDYRTYDSNFDRVRSQAADPRDSRRLLDTMRQEYR